MLDKIDYHIHTCYSDGEHTPEEIVDRYLADSYRRIAITDHDELEGSLVALWYSYGKDIDVIPGIELSTNDEHGNTVHILGYHINYSDKLLNDTLSRLRILKARRNDKLLKVLNDMGYNITIDELLSINDGRYIGKPTFAKALVGRGVADSVDDVFKGLFQDERIRTLKKPNLSTGEAISLIHHAGGVAVFAHPMELRKIGEDEDQFISRLAGLVGEMLLEGLDGIECYHPSATDEQSEILLNMAIDRGLCITRGSDYHSDDGRNYES